MKIQRPAASSPAGVSIAALQCTPTKYSTKFPGFSKSAKMEARSAGSVPSVGNEAGKLPLAVSFILLKSNSVG